MSNTLEQPQQKKSNSQANNKPSAKMILILTVVVLVFVVERPQFWSKVRDLLGSISDVFSKFVPLVPIIEGFMPDRPARTVFIRIVRTDDFDLFDGGSLCSSLTPIPTRSSF